LAAYFFVRVFVSRVAIKLKALRSIQFDNLPRPSGAAHDRMTTARVPQDARR
jgi:hypothetical protein